MSSETPANILVVDDTAANLQLLVSMLREEGHKVRPATSGTAALSLANHIPPDLMLLDINMPGMDGYEVCRRFKADPTLKDVPIIFISAMSEIFDKVRAFEVGGEDYIAKPFQMSEVKARIDTHLRLSRLRSELERSNRKLKETEQMRERLAHMIVHDMRAPLFGITGMLELADLCPGVSQDPQARDYIAHARDSARVLVEMISSMLDVYKMQSDTPIVRPEMVDVRKVIGMAVRLIGGLVRRVRFQLNQPSAALMVFCDKDLTSRVLVNLISNAIKHTPEDGEVSVEVAEAPAGVRIGVRDSGPGIAAKDRKGLFQLFGQVGGEIAPRKYSTGMGLVFCKMVVEAQRGAIGMESEPGRGSLFWFTIPKNPATPAPAAP